MCGVEIPKDLLLLFGWSCENVRCFVRVVGVSITFHSLWRMEGLCSLLSPSPSAYLVRPLTSIVGVVLVSNYKQIV